MSKNRYIYPAIINYANDGVSVEFPDLPGCITCGKDNEEALIMAKEAMALHLYGMEQDKDAVPSPSKINEISAGPNQAIALIEVLMPPFRKQMDQKAVKKTLTIPKWLDDLAKEKNVNFSQLLQKSLKEYLGIRTDR